MSKTDALARLALDSGAAEQLEDPLVIGGTDAAAIVLQLDQNSVARCQAGPDRDCKRTLGVSLFDGIVEQVAQHLFE